MTVRKCDMKTKYEQKRGRTKRHNEEVGGKKLYIIMCELFVAIHAR